MSLYYKDEFVELWHGDALELTEWVNADVLVTDPPYGIAWKIGNHPKRGSVAHRGIKNDQDTTARDQALELWGDRPGIVFGTWKAPFPVFKQVLVWQKPRDIGVIGSTTGYRRDTELIFLTGTWPKRNASRSSVLFPHEGSRSYIPHKNTHPHIKPVKLMESLIEWTTGTVADPFAGLGTTLVAAKIQGRKAIGVELDERHCESAAKRLEATT